MQVVQLYSTFPSAPCSFPHAAMTNASLTEIHAISCIPLFFSSAACSTKPGRWVWKQKIIIIIIIRSADYQCAQALLTVWTHFGTARCKCSRYSEEDSFLPLKQLIHSHLIPWLPLLDLHCRKMFTHLMRGEMTIQNNGDLHFTLLKWAILMCMSLEDIACTAICVTFSLHLHRSAAGWQSGGRGVFLYVRTNDRYKNTPI